MLLQMKPADSSSPSQREHVVRDPEAARLLTHPGSVRFFKPFIARELSASEAAEELGCQLNTMLYRIGTFLEAGLLRVTREQKRAGRPVKRYRAVADAFFIPFSLTPYATLEEGLGAQLEPLWETMLRGLARSYAAKDWFGRRIYRDESGAVFTSPFRTTSAAWGAEEASHPPVALFSDIAVDLTEGEAAALCERLMAILAEAHVETAAGGEAQKEGDKPYVLQVALVPLEL